MSLQLKLIQISYKSITVNHSRIDTDTVLRSKIWSRILYVCWCFTVYIWIDFMCFWSFSPMKRKFLLSKIKNNIIIQYIVHHINVLTLSWIGNSKDFDFEKKFGFNFFNLLKIVDKLLSLWLFFNVFLLSSWHFLDFFLLSSNSFSDIMLPTTDIKKNVESRVAITSSSPRNELVLLVPTDSVVS